MSHPSSSPNPRRKTVVIVGAGFSGTAVAANLLRSQAPLEIVLVNRFAPPGRGVAYGTKFEAHLLNVPAGLMSAFPDEPEHFLRYARSKDPDLTADRFVPRQLFGEYLAWLLGDSVVRRANQGTTFEAVVAECTSIEVAPGGLAAEVAFTARPPIGADAVVLALGNYSPSNPAGTDESFYASQRYVRDPWIPGALDVVAPGERVLVVGTGLTMMDIVLDLEQRGIARPIWAVSPRGLLPQPHLVPSGPPAPALASPIDAAIERPTAASFLRRFRAAVAACAGDGIGWRSVVGSVRSATPQLWRSLPSDEKKRFLRHVRPFWEVHRHRAAPATAAAIADLVRTEQLGILPGRVRGYREGDGEVMVSIQRRGEADLQEVVVDRVVNCTGPNTDPRTIEDRLLRSLLDSGLIQPDPLGLGVQVSPEGSVLDATGRPSNVLYLVGPLLKAGFWEATAVPELRQHAAALARRLSGTTP